MSSENSELVVPCTLCKGLDGRVPGALEDAVQRGHLKCVDQALKRHDELGMPISFYAAKHGRLEFLKYVRQNKINWDPQTTFLAAMHGHLHCLAYAYEHGCSLHSLSVVAAAQRGHVDCLKYMFENCGDDAPWQETGLDEFEQRSLMPEHVKEYLRSVCDAWKGGYNVCAGAVKPAKAR